MVKWTPFTNSVSASPMWLMQDGTVLGCTDGQTLKFLHPDPKGSYADGIWSDAGKFLLAKDNFASAVLADGRLVACGGEQSGPGFPQTETNFCEIYDPLKKSSTRFQPPTGWGAIGDSPSVVLTDGTFMLGNTQGKGDQVALLDAATLTWTFGGGDSDNEQGYVLLQTGDVLTANVFNQTSMRYDPSLKKFVQDGNLPVMLGAGSEIGPGMTLMDGRVVWFGASGHTCIYKAGAKGQNGSWTQGPDLPTMADGNQLVCNDSSAILEPNGKVFVVAWWGTKGLVVFLEYDPGRNQFTVVDGAPNTTNREAAKMLLLPNGHGLVWIAEPTNALYDLTFDSGAQASWAPTITSFPLTAARNQTVTLTGTQLCGLSECQHFGDDNQQAENYPMVRFIDGSGGVTYARAHDITTRSIAPEQSGSVLVEVPDSLALGTYSVEAVAMGLPSKPVTVILSFSINNGQFQGMSGAEAFVLGSDGKLWLEHAGTNGKFGAVPPPREQVDGNVANFQALSGAEAFVLGSDGKLWLEHAGSSGKFGAIPPPREQVDGNVIAFQALSETEAFVLGSDGKLWLEHAGVNGKFGAVPPPREQVDGNVAGFRVLSATEVLVLGGDGKLWLEHAGANGKFGAVPPPREQVDGNVANFQALSGAEAFVLGSDGKLWLEHAGANGKFGTIPPPREQVDGNVLNFQALSNIEVFVLGRDANLWLEHAGSNGKFGTVPPPREQVDGNVA